MAIAARQELESEHLTEVRGQFTGIKQFKVWNEDSSTGAATEIDISQARAASGVPDIGGFFSGAFPALTCTRIEYRHLVGMHVYQVFAHYESPPTYLPPNAQGFLETQRVWRKGAIPASPDPPANQDIGGVKIDENGKPVDVDVWRMRFSLPRALQADTIDELRPQLFLPVIGSVNVDVYHDFAPGTIKYLGPMSHPTSPEGGGLQMIIKGWHLVNFDFLYDRDFHLTQFPKIGQTGAAERVFDVGTLSWHASPVYWRRERSPIAFEGLP